MINEALALYELGFNVMPVHPGSKIPALKWRDIETVSEDDVNAWWYKEPEANVGIITNNFVVLDADSMESADWIRKNITWTPWRVRTSKGVHFYFKCKKDIRNSVNTNSKIDVRGSGGYVVGAGSIHETGHVYSWEPRDIGAEECFSVDDLPELLDSDIRKMNAFTGKERVGNLFNFEVTAPLNDGGESKGSRNDTLARLVGKWAGLGYDENYITFSALEWDSKNNPPLGEKKVRYHLKSLFQTFKSNGNSVKQANYDVEDEKEVKKEVRKRVETPTELLKPPGLCGELCEYINKNARSPLPILSVGAVLALMGTVMGRKVRGELGTRTNYYNVSLAKTGTGKNHAREMISNILDEIGAEHLNPVDSIASDAALNDVISETPSVLLRIDEINKELKAINSSKASNYEKRIVDELLIYFTSADGKKKKRAYAKASERENESILNPNLSIYGTGTPDGFFKGASYESISDGFLTRCLFFQSQEEFTAKKKRLRVKEPNKHIIGKVKKVYELPLNCKPTGDIDEAVNVRPRTVYYSDSAWKKVEEFQDIIEEETKSLKAKNMVEYSDFWTRAEEHLHKIALTLSVSDLKFEIEDKYVEYAIKLVRHLIHDFIFSCESVLSENQEERNKKRVIEIISNKGSSGINKSELTRKTFFLSTNQRNSVLNDLCESNIIEVVVSPTPTKPKTIIKLV